MTKVCQQGDREHKSPSQCCSGRIAAFLWQSWSLSKTKKEQSNLQKMKDAQDFEFGPLQSRPVCSVAADLVSVSLQRDFCGEEQRGRSTVWYDLQQIECHASDGKCKSSGVPTPGQRLWLEGGPIGPEEYKAERRAKKSASARRLFPTICPLPPQRPPPPRPSPLSFPHQSSPPCLLPQDPLLPSQRSQSAWEQATEPSTPPPARWLHSVRHLPGFPPDSWADESELEDPTIVLWNVVPEREPRRMSFRSENRGMLSTRWARPEDARAARFVRTHTQHQETDSFEEPTQQRQEPVVIDHSGDMRLTCTHVRIEGHHGEVALVGDDSEGKSVSMVYAMSTQQPHSCAREAAELGEESAEGGIQSMIQRLSEHVHEVVDRFRVQSACTAHGPMGENENNKNPEQDTRHHEDRSVGSAHQQHRNRPQRLIREDLSSAQTEQATENPSSPLRTDDVTDEHCKHAGLLCHQHMYNKGIDSRLGESAALLRRQVLREAAERLHHLSHHDQSHYGHQRSNRNQYAAPARVRGPHCLEDMQSEQDWLVEQIDNASLQQGQQEQQLQHYTEHHSLRPIAQSPCMHSVTGVRVEIVQGVQGGGSDSGRSARSKDPKEPEAEVSYELGKGDEYKERELMPHPAQQPAATALPLSQAHVQVLPHASDEEQTDRNRVRGRDRDRGREAGMETENAATKAGAEDAQPASACLLPLMHTSSLSHPAHHNSTAADWAPARAVSSHVKLPARSLSTSYALADSVPTEHRGLPFQSDSQSPIFHHPATSKSPNCWQMATPQSSSAPKYQSSWSVMYYPRATTLGSLEPSATSQSPRNWGHLEPATLVAAPQSPRRWGYYQPATVVTYAQSPQRALASRESFARKRLTSLKTTLEEQGETNFMTYSTPKPSPAKFVGSAARTRETRAAAGEGLDIDGVMLM